MLEVKIEKIVPVTEARDSLNKLVDEVESSDELYVLTKNGKPASVLVGVHHLEKLTGMSHDELMDDQDEVEEKTDETEVEPVNEDTTAPVAGALDQTGEALDLTAQTPAEDLAGVPIIEESEFDPLVDINEPAPENEIVSAAAPADIPVETFSPTTSDPVAQPQVTDTISPAFTSISQPTISSDLPTPPLEDAIPSYPHSSVSSVASDPMVAAQTSATPVAPAMPPSSPSAPADPANEPSPSAGMSFDPLDFNNTDLSSNQDVNPDLAPATQAAPVPPATPQAVPYASLNQPSTPPAPNQQNQ